MPTSEHKYSIDDLIAALLRDQGIHDGHWALNIEFSATGAAVKPQDQPTRTLPGLIVSVNSATPPPSTRAKAGRRSGGRPARKQGRRRCNKR
jgi:hypothetical protein